MNAAVKRRCDLAVVQDSLVDSSRDYLAASLLSTLVFPEAFPQLDGAPAYILKAGIAYPLQPDAWVQAVPRMNETVLDLDESYQLDKISWPVLH